MGQSRTLRIILAIAALAALAAYAWSSGYRVGEDMAIRDGRSTS
jgi:hypothetical protein